MNIKNRLLDFISEKKINKAAFEKKVGLGNGYVNNITKNPTTDTLNKISKVYPELNITWLLTGEGGMLINNENTPASETKPDYLTTRRNLKNNDTQTMPVFDIGSRLGTVPTYNDSNESLIGELPKNLFPGCNHAEIVRGDSMHPLVRNGALVVCKRFDKKLIFNGDLYLIHADNGLNSCKYIHKLKDKPDRLKLVSYNKEVPEDEIGYDEIRDIYRVLFIINPA